MNYNIYVISNKPHRFPVIAESISPVRIHFFNGSGFESFSKLVNSCVAACPTETVIMVGDKVTPKAHHVDKTLELLDKGYGFVGLYRFGFFGFRKELFRKIGFMDERYVGGGFEDYDFYVRLIESDIASYISEEVDYMVSQSTWSGSRVSFDWWPKKWRHHWDVGTPWPKMLERTVPEERYNYDLGPSTHYKFLSSKLYSHYTDSLHVMPFFNMKII